MDPFSITVGTLALMGVCASVAHGLRIFIEKAKTSKAILITLLRKVERTRLYLGQLRSIAARLTDPSHRQLLVPFDQKGCKATMKRLKDLVKEIGGAAGDAGAIKTTIGLIQKKRVAEMLVKELEDHQENISQSLLALAA